MAALLGPCTALRAALMLLGSTRLPTGRHLLSQDAEGLSRVSWALYIALPAGC